MKKILISFIGNNDCLLREGKEGAIISILKERNFDILYLLYNDNRYLQYASDILIYCKKHFPNLTVRYLEAEAFNPIDYNIVYPSMVAAVNNILNEEGTKDVEYTISLTSGTPTMHSCWILIVLGGIIQAKLIQTSKEAGIQEVNFSLDDFPQIVTDKQLKIELTKKDRENKLLRKSLTTKYPELIGEDESIIKVKLQIDHLINYNIPIFIYGESGTGKEVVAQILHYYGPHKEAPLVAVNCGAINENLFESEFFGHKKGSFTGAISDHEGYFSQANGGTLFLDEIADLPSHMQVKLLRALETGVIQPIGSKPKKINIRIITASNKDLDKLVYEGKFREDLYYRINQAKIELLPLRQRGSDIILLARYFLEKYSELNGIVKKLSPIAEKKLLQYHYPGNVRELQNIIKFAYINSDSNLINSKDIIFPSINNYKNRIEIPPEGVDLEHEIIPSYYQAALTISKGNASEAARLLGLKPHTFRARLKSIENGKYIYRTK